MPGTPEPRVTGPHYEREITVLIAKLSKPVRDIEQIIVYLYLIFFVDSMPKATVRLSRYYLARSHREDAEQALAYLRGYEPSERPFELVFHPPGDREQTGLISLRVRATRTPS
ncbi:hypothetical protein HY478_03710 [Candidatus Uhrbacteria bacterium]|nr:hypothetical protein [Candidatus Uhrbacteria bacterium]